MNRQVVSRTQRRMEKRQALILLVLILGVSLVSFTLGVMVGRSGSHDSGATAVSPAAPRLPVAAKGEGGEITPPAPAAERPAENLTFYDTLPKGEQPPLGSGINLPPRLTSKMEQEKPAAPSEPVRKADPAPAVKEASRPQASPEGAYVVQAASFRGSEDALKLKERLSGKAYAAYTEQADLKEKGIWHRVYVGPFATAEAAGRVVEKLQAEEKLAALVKKR
jgi:cell division septation protein DedD